MFICPDKYIDSKSIKCVIKVTKNGKYRNKQPILILVHRLHEKILFRHKNCKQKIVFSLKKITDLGRTFYVTVTLLKVIPVCNTKTKISGSRGYKEHLDQCYGKNNPRSRGSVPSSKQWCDSSIILYSNIFNHLVLKLL